MHNIQYHNASDKKNQQNLLSFFYFCVKIIMRFTQYIYFPSSTVGIVLIVSEKIANGNLKNASKHGHC